MTLTLLLIVLLVACGVVTAWSAIALVRHDRELERLARDLSMREPADNARLTLHVRSAGLVAIANAVNRELDAERDRRVADGAARDAFQKDLAALSHDVRTPLAGAQGYLQLAARANTQGERDRYMGSAVERLDAMRVLVDGLFDYAKASDPSFEPECAPVSLMPLVSDVLLGFYPQFTEKRWEPELSCAADDIAALANADALRRVIANLVSNALRHGTGAPVIAIEATDNEVALRIQNPVGNPESIDVARLFDRFYRSDTARTGEGSGLGLAIVAQLVRSMSGTVEASIADGHLCIEVRLPRVA